MPENEEEEEGMPLTSPVTAMELSSNRTQTSYYALQTSSSVPKHHLESEKTSSWIVRNRLKLVFYVSVISLVFLFIFLLCFFLWPSQPTIQVVRVYDVSISTRKPSLLKPSLRFSLSMNLSVEIRNPNYFSVEYRSLTVSIGYRGRNLANGTSDSGIVKARKVSYLDVNVKSDGVDLIGNSMQLIQDMSNGSIPFETRIEVGGNLRAFSSRQHYRDLEIGNSNASGKERLRLSPFFPGLLLVLNLNWLMVFA